MEFDETQLGTISNALRVAADQFGQDAERISQLNFPSVDSLVKQMIRQQTDAMVIYNHIAVEYGIAN